MAVTYLCHFIMTKGYEEIEASGSVLEKKNKITGKNLLRSLFANPQLLLLMLADLMKWIPQVCHQYGCHLLFPRRNAGS